MRKASSLKRNLLAALLQAGLVAALVAAVWGVYSRVPDGGSPFRDESGGATTLRVVLRRAPLPEPPDKVALRLYPINMTAARSEFDSERRPGVRFEEFVTRLMGGRQPVSAELDERGEAAIVVPHGRWWVHATVGGPRELTWRLPVTVTGRELTVELTPENAYARAKRF